MLQPFERARCGTGDDASFRNESTVLRQSLAAAFAALALLLPCAPAAAFDTGPHASITVDATMRAGLNRSAADAVQVENWLTDYYTSSPTFGSAGQCDLEKLHFDDVFSTNDVADYWSTLLANTKDAVRAAEQHNDVVEFYTVLGMSLHVVQDFYSHSNWVEQIGAVGGPYRTRSWFDAPPPAGAVFTGWYPNCLNIPQGNHDPHGGYTSGMNHDSVVRPRYDRAYVYAYAASYEWTMNVLSWLGANFANQVKSYNPSASDASDLAYDQKASIYVSEWIQNPVNKANLDGHWNGNRSGYAAAFAKFTAQWTAAHNSVYVRTFKQSNVYAALSKNLYSGPPAPPSAFANYPTNGIIFGMRTLSVYANRAITGTDSYFGTLVGLNVGNANYPYRDASQYHLPRTAVPWLQLTYVPAGQPTVDFAYTLWNEWNTTNNDQVPIKGGQTTLRFSCSTSNAACSGDVAGGPWTAANPFTTGGSGSNGVKVQWYFTTEQANQ
jgi:hypothetical protein